jgi:hypothetical protein
MSFDVPLLDKTRQQQRNTNEETINYVWERNFEKKKHTHKKKNDRRRNHPFFATTVTHRHNNKHDTTNNKQHKHTQHYYQLLPFYNSPATRTMSDYLDTEDSDEETPKM